RLFLAGAEVVELGLEPAGGWYGPGSRALDQIVGAAEAAAARGLVDERLGRVDHAAADEPVVLGKDVAARGRHGVPGAVGVEAAIGSGDVGDELVDLGLGAAGEWRGGWRQGSER